MKNVLTLTTLTLLALAGCESASKNKVESAQFPCTCGTPQTAVDGCLHSACLSGEGNPDNPDCCCAPLDVTESN